MDSHQKTYSSISNTLDVHVEGADHCDSALELKSDLSAWSIAPASVRDEEQEKAERVARLQQYRQGMWELNFDLHAFERWRQVGSAQGLTSDTDIACFLLLHFEKTSKQVSPILDSMCSKCQSVLTQSCPKCHPPSLPSDLSLVTSMTNKAGVDIRSQEVLLRKLQDYWTTLTKKDSCGGAGERSEEELVCSLCNVTFTCSTSLKVHMQKHTGGRPYVCDTCGTTFKHSSSLSVHKRSHTGVKPYVCEKCGAAFAVGSVLKQHMRKHSGEKPYKCQLCPSAFTQGTKLTIHMRKHTGARPYQCEQCGAAFTHSNRLQIHLRSHSGHRPYKCGHCGKGFTQSAHLTVHARIHTGDKPFKCAQCGAAFLDSTHLRRHERTHSAEKPHVCKECGLAYSTAFGLRRHEWSHTAHDKPYTCEHCSSTFSTNFCLKRHQSTAKCAAKGPPSHTVSSGHL